ncbi:MAG: deoxyribose-phosphate aldolase [Synergistaceae bacterium]|jgi:deoxyribose-phosphate aldolase|nr:deoxyribose-phosphate aldolase [Synergistaceae bacterium]
MVKKVELTQKQLAKMIDHTLLKATATPAQIEAVCQEALAIGAASVCINPVNVRQAAEILKGSDVKVCTVIGFPLGANTSATKAFETSDAIAAGAQEIDMVIDIGALKAGIEGDVREDIKAVVKAADGVPVKVILETCYLTDEEKIVVCRVAAEAGASFVKTSTGFGTGGATPDDVALMRANIPPHMKVKASGGMRSWQDALPNIEAGADRLGVSASIAILEGVNSTIEI